MESMNINVILLDYDRHDYTQRVKDVNFNNAGYPFDFTIVDMKGISKAINYGIFQSRTYDAVVTMANDILMPNSWLERMVQAMITIPNSGMIGIHTVESISEPTTINGLQVHIQEAAFGNVLIPMKAIDKIGYFNEAYDPYGMQDRDYSYRLQMTGHLNYYLSGLRAEHIGHDVGQDTPYRRMKDEGLSKCDYLWARETGKYQEENNYTIYQTEWL
jgi:glycosyltransferase involved in cell wall biosynthesis